MANHHSTHCPLVPCARPWVATGLASLVMAASQLFQHPAQSPSHLPLSGSVRRARHRGTLGPVAHGRRRSRKRINGVGGARPAGRKRARRPAAEFCAICYRVSMRELARDGQTTICPFGFDTSLFPGIPSIVGPYNIFDARVNGQNAFDRNPPRSMNAVSPHTRPRHVRRDQPVSGRRLPASRIQDTARTQVTTADSLADPGDEPAQCGAAPGIDVVRAQVQVQAQKQRLMVAERSRQADAAAGASHGAQRDSGRGSGQDDGDRGDRRVAR